MFIYKGQKHICGINNSEIDQNKIVEIKAKNEKDRYNGFLSIWKNPLAKYWQEVNTLYLVQIMKLKNCIEIKILKTLFQINLI